MNGRQELVLLPTERHVDAARMRGERAQTYASFVRAAFDGASHDVLLAGESVTRLATARALADVTPRRRGQGALASPQLAAAFDRTIGHLRRAGALPQHLRATGTPRGTMLADVMGHVDEQFRHAGCVDERGIGRVLAEHADAVALLARGPVLVRGRLAFDQADFAWMTALEACTGGRMSVTIELPAGRVLAHEDPFEHLEARLQARIADANFAPLFLHEELRPVRDVRVVEAGDVASEARAVAWHVARELEAGVRPERIAVVLSHSDEGLLEPLRSAFYDAKLPFADSSSRPPSASGAAVAALAIMRLAAGPVTRTVLIDLLSNPAVDGRRWALGPDSTTARRELVRLAQALRTVPLSADATGTGFVRALYASQRPERASLCSILERIIRDIERLRHEPTRRSVLGHFDELVLALGLAVPSVEALRSAIRHGAGVRALAGLGDGFAAARAVLEASARARLAAVMLGTADTRVDVSTVAAELDAAMSVRASDERVATASAAVAWLSPTDAAGLTLDAVVLVGASSALERAAIARADTLLDDATWQTLPPSLRPAHATDAAAMAHAEVAWVLAAADRAVVTHAVVDASGRESPPSQLIGTLLSGRAPDERAPASRVSPASHVVGVRAHRIRDLASGAAEPTAEVRELASIERRREQFFLGASSPATSYDGDASGAADHLVALIGGTRERPLAVTALEGAAQCRFLAFVRTGLRVVREADVDEVSDRREYGNLVHDALEKAFRALHDASTEHDSASRKALAIAAADESLAPQQHAGALRRYAIRRVRRTVEAVVDEYLASPSDLRFYAAEQAFGEAKEGSWDPLVVSYGGEEVVLRGRIDRLDWSPERRALRAVDYKTGESVSPRKDWGVFAFQPVFYAQVAARELNAEGLSAAYLSARDRVVWKPAEKNQRLEPALFITAAQRALAIVGELHSGAVLPRPADASFCAACEARDVCRRPPFAADTSGEGE